MLDFLSKKDKSQEQAEAYDVSGALGVIVAGPPNVFQPFMALGPGNPSGVQVVTTTRDAADLAADVVQFKPHLVLLSPEVRGYTPELVRQMVDWPAYPLAVVGLVPATGTFGAEMAGQGAVGFYNTPIGPSVVEKFAKEARGLVETAREKWSKPVVDSGVDRRVLEAIGAQAYKTGVITFWSAKGGDGKTVIAVNTAALLSLVAGQRVLLIDNDMNCGRVYLHLNIPTGQNTLLHLASDLWRPAISWTARCSSAASWRPIGSWMSAPGQSSRSWMCSSGLPTLSRPPRRSCAANRAGCS
jgi:hypothetical protein